MASQVADDRILAALMKDAGLVVKGISANSHDHDRSRL
jgi:hypothetical protein